MLRELYRRVFRRLAGKGFGLGIFNRVHRWVWQRWLQPESVSVLGFRLYLPPDDTGMSQALQMGEVFEAPMVERFREVVRPGMTVLDLGANVGYYTVLASRLVGPAGKVLAVEPELVNVRYLARNVAANACANVWIAACAAGERFGEVDLYLSSPSRSGHTLIEPRGGHAGTQRVGVAPLDELAAPLRPNVVKMDIEGGEAMALRGMRRMLQDAALQAVFIECNREILAQQGSSAERLLEPLRAAGFAVEDIDGVNFLCRREARG